MTPPKVVTDAELAKLIAEMRERASLPAWQLQRQKDWASRLQAIAARETGEPLSENYIQQVPDKCDRITWRGNYYHLPISQTPTPAAPGWQDIASAPRDGTKVLLTFGGDPVAAFWSNDLNDWILDSMYLFDAAPVAWHRMPPTYETAAPAAQKEKGDE
jgi:hypothetical protein